MKEMIQENIDENLLKGKWNQIKGQVKQQWGELTDDDIDRMRGNREEMIGVLQERYGKTEAEAEQEIDQFLNAFKETQS
jgi:uncharacterized protein YjbJ (UPF0337 family)